MEKRLSDMELAIKELTVLNKSQQKTTEQLVDNINRVLSSMQEVAVLRVKIDTNIVDVNKLGNKLDKVVNTITEKEHYMSEQILENKEELKTLGGNRLIRGVTMASAFTIFLFGYLYTDIHTLMDKFSTTLDSVELIVQEGKKQNYYIEKKLSELNEEVKSHRSVHNSK